MSMVKIVDVEFTDVIGLQSGLIFSSKGFNYDIEETWGEGYEGTDKVTTNYLEIPINLAFKISDFQIYAGPYLAFCLGGNNTWDVTYEDDNDYDESDEMKIKPVFGEVGEDDLDDDEGAINALDYGLNVGIGYQAGPMLFNAGYSLGLANFTSEFEGSDIDPKDFKQTNSVISLSVSFFF